MLKTTHLSYFVDVTLSALVKQKKKKSKGDWKWHISKVGCITLLSNNLWGDNKNTKKTSKGRLHI
jgi:hypothetical protein